MDNLLRCLLIIFILPVLVYGDRIQLNEYVFMCTDELTIPDSGFDVEIFIAQNNNFKNLKQRGKLWDKHYRKVNQLVMRNNNISYIEDYTFVLLSNLNQLDLSNNNLEYLTDNTFSGLVSLKSLILSHNKLTAVRRSLFNDLSSLEILDISFNNIIFIPAGLVKENAHLKEFDVSYNPINLLDDAPFIENDSINILLMNNCNISHLPKETFKHLRNITELYLSNNNIENFEAGLLRNLASLKYLELNNNKINNVSCGLLNQHAEIEDIGMENNPVSLSIIELLKIWKTKREEGENEIEEKSSLNVIREKELVTSVPPVITPEVKQNLNAIVNEELNNFTEATTCKKEDNMQGISELLIVLLVISNLLLTTIFCFMFRKMESKLFSSVSLAISENQNKSKEQPVKDSTDFVELTKLIQGKFHNLTQLIEKLSKILKFYVHTLRKEIKAVKEVVTSASETTDNISVVSQQTLVDTQNLYDEGIQVVENLNKKTIKAIKKVIPSTSEMTDNITVVSQQSLAVDTQSVPDEQIQVIENLNAKTIKDEKTSSKDIFIQKIMKAFFEDCINSSHENVTDHTTSILPDLLANHEISNNEKEELTGIIMMLKQCVCDE